MTACKDWDPQPEDEAIQADKELMEQNDIYKILEKLDKRLIALESLDYLPLLEAIVEAIDNSMAVFQSDRARVVAELNKLKEVGK